MSENDAVKFQLFEAAELYPPEHELDKMFKSVELSPDWLELLQRHAGQSVIAFFASAFDPKSVDRLAVIDVPDPYSNISVPVILPRYLV